MSKTESEVVTFSDDAVARLGGIDILVSNAGLRRQTPFLEMDLAEWREILSVALDGAFILAHAAVPPLLHPSLAKIYSLTPCKV